MLQDYRRPFLGGDAGMRCRQALFCILGQTLVDDQQQGISASRRVEVRA
jgi:hypothetical protein